MLEEDPVNAAVCWLETVRLRLGVAFLSLTAADSLRRASAAAAAADPSGVGKDGAGVCRPPESVWKRGATVA